MPAMNIRVALMAAVSRIAAVKTSTSPVTRNGMETKTVANLSSKNCLQCGLPFEPGDEGPRDSHRTVYECYKAQKLVIEQLRARIDSVHDARLVWAMACRCTCDACDVFYEAVRDQLPDEEEQKP